MHYAATDVCALCPRPPGACHDRWTIGGDVDARRQLISQQVTDVQRVHRVVQVEPGAGGIGCAGGER